ncbi:MAG: 4-hydroxybenzoate octaprenyltransferase, partial [Candidatus Dadabacteria bacterium]|nr:4-hydroxybenzoate octaprenyltransferase [Candidatus Dadabacteria bacterium]NIQ13212.1 4-hydroxybenzoate octaprenyltransferase [Candidatus Dadabacteria bacterium]
KIDSQNPRTKDRELPSGKISSFNAYLLTLFGLIVYLFAAYKICWLAFILSPVPIVVFIVYPLMKRFTPLCHFGVGIGLALAPLGGWIAVKCSFTDITPGILISLFAFFWVSGFDIIYATLDEKYDVEEGIYSMVSVYGRGKALLISAIVHILAFLMLFVLYITNIKSIVSGLILLLIGYFLYLEHKKSENVDIAFFKINILIGSLVFIFVLAGIYLP